KDGDGERPRTRALRALPPRRGAHRTALERRDHQRHARWPAVLQRAPGGGAGRLRPAPRRASARAGIGRARAPHGASGTSGPGQLRADAGRGGPEARDRRPRQVGAALGQGLTRGASAWTPDEGRPIFEVRAGGAMAINVALRKKIRVNGKEYESLEQIPAELRTAVEKPLASSQVAATIRINGKTVSSAEELPSPVRAIVRDLASVAMK